jgi:hypothetical protein
MHPYYRRCRDAGATHDPRPDPLSSAPPGTAQPARREPPGSAVNPPSTVPATPTAPAESNGSAAGLSGRVRSRLATTPGRLRLATLAVIVVLALAWLAAATTVRARQSATHRVGLETEPLLVGAQDIYASLADADATEANAFLTGGLEPATLRTRYDDDIKRATDRLTDVTRQIAGSSEALAAAKAVTQQVPVYTGLVEAARANNRQLFPVGAAYLRQASELMHKHVLVAANGLYQAEARRLDQSYHSGASVADFIGVVAAGGVLLLILLLTQVYLAQRTKRILNVGLVAATVIAVVLLGWVITTFATEQRQLSRARHNGSDPVKVLAEARILALDAETDESLALVGRGGGQKYTNDFTATIARLGGPDGNSGLLGQATVKGGGTFEILSSYKAFLTTHAMVQRLATNGQFTEAITTATTGEFGPADSKFAKLDTAISTAVDNNQLQFVNAAASARSAFRGITIGITVLALAIGLLALIGTQQRINDYR